MTATPAPNIMQTYQQIKQKHQEAYNKIMDDSGVFWAFSNEQFAEGLEKLKTSGQLLPGDKLARVTGGGLVPSKNADKMMELLKQADKTQKQKLKQAKQAKNEAILYELQNHECFYTGDYSPVIDIFKGIYTPADIKKVYQANININD